MKRPAALTVVGVVGALILVGLGATSDSHVLHAVIWLVAFGVGAGVYVRGARRRDEERLLRSGDRLLERSPSSLDPQRLEGRAQAQADRFSNSPRNVRR